MRRFCLAISFAGLFSAPAWATNPVCPPGLAPFQITGPNFPQQSIVDDAGNTWSFTANPSTIIEGSMTCTPPTALIWKMSNPEVRATIGRDLFRVAPSYR